MSDDDVVDHCLFLIQNLIEETRCVKMLDIGLEPVYFDEEELLDESLPAARRTYLQMKKESRERIVFVLHHDRYHIYDDDCLFLRRKALIPFHTWCDGRPIHIITPKKYNSLCKEFQKEGIPWTTIRYEVINDMADEMHMLRQEVSVLKKFIDELSS